MTRRYGGADGWVGRRRKLVGWMERTPSPRRQGAKGPTKCGGGVWRGHVIFRLASKPTLIGGSVRRTGVVGLQRNSVKIGP